VDFHPKELIRKEKFVSSKWKLTSGPQGRHDAPVKFLGRFSSLSTSLVPLSCTCAWFLAEGVYRVSGGNRPGLYIRWALVKVVICNRSTPSLSFLLVLAKCAVIPGIGIACSTIASGQVQIRSHAHVVFTFALLFLSFLFLSLLAVPLRRLSCLLFSVTIKDWFYDGQNDNRTQVPFQIPSHTPSTYI
jgi:hypothetical protein